MDAVEWLARARRCAAAIEPCQRELSALLWARDACEGWTCSGGRGGPRGVGTVSDPTATAAEQRISSLSSAIADKRRELDALEQVVGDALRAIAAVGDAMGERAASVLELYYVDRVPTWSEVACELGVTRETVRADRDRALWWMDEHVPMV